ncbi:ATP-binding protein [Sphingosinicella sp.]|uniref:ATP-binding protein n=1 Tax=Sphingosinicella sp. TaxID=1917971 RepID=UPI0018302F1F|nr:ATP-binding protein [Sphingosinicella sp.]MBA4758376.1 ATP-binding protein [Sphingosinicella sp.]
MTILSLQAKQDFLEKDASTRDPIKGIAEFVWNALDADATEVRVELKKNELGGIVAIRIIDNGHGIAPERADHDFSNLGASHKRTTVKTKALERAVHGKEGRGRLKFFSLARRARWTSVSEKNGKRSALTLTIQANNLENCDRADAIETEDDIGTTVELSPLKEALDILDSPDAFRQFSTIFAPYVLQYPDARIYFNGFEVDPRITIHKTHDIPQSTIVCPNRIIEDLRVKVIEWSTPTESRQIFFGGDNGIVLGSQAAYVTAPNFTYSAYAYSSFFRELADANLLDLEGINDPDFLHVLEHIRSDLKDYFRQRQADLSRGLIQELKDQGAYPYEGEPSDEVEKRERQVFDIATYAVSSHSREFARADSSLKLMTLTFLKEAVKHNPDALSTILRAVVNLPKAQQNEFSELLQRTELGNIISSSSLIADRVATLSILRSMVFEPKYRQTVKERGHLDALVRDNTWLFGEQFHFTLPEAGLSRVMERVAHDLGSKGKKEKVTKQDGKRGRVDQFLGRVVPGPEQGNREYLLIELKRPSLKVGRKELVRLKII